MDIKTFRLCRAARELAQLHGVFFAAAFLAEQRIPIEIALALLAKKYPITDRPAS